jgi:hypothetical protein
MRENMMRQDAKGRTRKNCKEQRTRKNTWQELKLTTRQGVKTGKKRPVHKNKKKWPFRCPHSILKRNGGNIIHRFSSKKEQGEAQEGEGREREGAGGASFPRSKQGECNGR